MGITAACLLHVSLDTWYSAPASLLYSSLVWIGQQDILEGYLNKPSGLFCTQGWMS